VALVVSELDNSTYGTIRFVDIEKQKVNLYHVSYYWPVRSAWSHKLNSNQHPCMCAINTRPSTFKGIMLPLQWGRHATLLRKWHPR
jgi:hypothetical protein